MTRWQALVLALVLVACQHGVEVGATCSASSECTVPLVCRLARCRNECTASRDCPVGARCLLDPSSGLGACSLASDDRCESGGAACPSGLTCLGMRCVNTCTSASDCPSDDECREVAGAGVSFCFAPTREDGGLLDAASSEDAGLDATTQDDAAMAVDAATTIDAASPTDGGSSCATVGCAIDLCVGETFACAVRGDHAVVCWGSNGIGQLGDGMDLATPHPHPSFSCLDPSGTMPMDCSATPVQVLRADGSGPLMADLVACASGTACARELTTGQILCWGAGSNGELGGSSSTPAFRAQPVGGLPAHPLSISGGRAFLCATFASGTDAVCWGDDSDGQFGLAMSATGNPHAVPHWDGQALVTGGTNTCGLAANTVQCAGDDLYGQTGPSTTVDAGIQYGPVTVPLPSGAVTSLAAGDSFACALVDGVANCWGFALTGSLGRTAPFTCSGYACDAHPAPIDGSAHFDVLWAEGYTSRICGRSGADTLCWGQYSEIGCEPGVDCLAPRVVPELAGATQVATSTRSLCAIVGGVVVCSGNDAFGQLGRGSVGTMTGLEADYQSVCLGGSGC